MRWLIGLGLYLWLFAAPVQAAVVINEILPNPVGDDTENEWIELYNTDSVGVVIEGYVLEDKNGKQMTLTGNLDKWLVIYPKDEVNLTNSGSTIKLLVDGQVVDSFTYGSSSEGKSFGRIPDGGEISTDKLTPTEGAANAPAATATASPTPTESPTSTPTPTFTPTVKPTVLPTVTPKPTAQVLAAKTEVEPDNEVTMAAEVQATATPSATPQPETNKQGKWPWLMMIGGGGLAVAALFPFLRKWYHDPSWLKTLLKGGDRSSFGQE